MEINESSIIGKLVAEDYRLSSVFDKYGIDFCCNGNISLQQASEDANVEISEIISALQNVLIKTDQQVDIQDFDHWSLDRLADYIEKKHHKYITEQITIIEPYLKKIKEVHGEKHPELSIIEGLFKQSAGELTMHMKKEELMLFPFIKRMAKAKSDNLTIQRPGFGSIKNPIDVMMMEHLNEGDVFKEINTLSDGFKVPEDGCNTYGLTLYLLKLFEQDLHIHLHLENNILFPKAIELEKELFLN